VTIYFYSPHESPYDSFSNFSRHGFKLDGVYLPTSEHYVQVQKFAGTLARFTPRPGDESIVENAPGDYYWGCGANGNGKNGLGVLLMELRALRREQG